MFLYIQSHLASIRLLSMAHHPSLARQGSAPAAADVHPSTTSGSNSLAPDVQQWEVQWEDIRVVRPIGRGSFGRASVAAASHAGGCFLLLLLLLLVAATAAVLHCQHS